MCCFWLDTRDKVKMVEQYEAGYRSKPESADKLKAMETLAADAFDEECNEKGRSNQAVDKAIKFALAL